MVGLVKCDSDNSIILYYKMELICAKSVRFYTIVIVSFITPLLYIGFRSTISLAHGDFYLFNQTNLYKAMQVCSQNTISFPQGSHFCKDYYFAKVNEDSNMTYENLTMFVNIQPTFEDDTVTKGYFWIPNNSTVYRFHDIVRVVNLSMIVKSKTPCLDRIKEDYNHIQYSGINFDCLFQGSPTFLNRGPH